MTEQRPPRRESTLIKIERTEVKPRELPRAPEDERDPWTLSQIAGAAMLVVTGFAVLAFFALGLPLSLVGGPLVLALPLLGVVMFVRGNRRRR